jgi:UDP-N-acetylglucosamine 2-epimerase (non-hydrolysing)
MESLRLACVVGARPNFMKMAALLHEVRKRPGFSACLIHTGQHFSPEMSAEFFRDLGMPEPDWNLEVGGGTHAQQTATIMQRLEPVFLKTRPDLLMVVGDVNSTVAAALVAAKLHIRVAHVEAGLRSFDRSMPEEINRIVTDVLSDFLFASESSGMANLAAEGIPAERAFLVGNVMIDTLLRFRAKAARSDVLARLGLARGAYAVVTMHRPSNVDDVDRLRGLMDLLACVGERLPVVFPVHPRTRERIAAAGLCRDGLLLLPPQGYLDFLRLMSEARLVLTDSGGIQEETTILGVPCLTMRENTERPVTIEKGTNRLVGSDPAAVLRAAVETLDAPPRRACVPDLWDGHAAARIFDVLERALRT